MSLDEIIARVVGNQVHVAVVLDVEIVADTDSPFVGGVCELAKHIALATLPTRCCDRVRCVLAWPQRKTTLMMSLPTAVPKVGAMRKMLQYVYMNGRAGIAAHCDDDLSHAHGRRGRHPIFCVKIGGVEDVRFEAWLQRTAQCQVGEAGGAMGRREREY